MDTTIYHSIFGSCYCQCHRNKNATVIEEKRGGGVKNTGELRFWCRRFFYKSKSISLGVTYSKMNNDFAQSGSNLWIWIFLIFQSSKTKGESLMKKSGQNKFLIINS